MEWPTVAVTAAIVGGLAATVALHQQLPAAVEIAVLGLLAAWYNSLQHEVIHGHPTPWHAVNTAVAIVPLGLVAPFRRYRAQHLDHHRTLDITDPDTDPESFYVTPQTWASAGPLHRWYLTATRTLLGRMVLGPPVIAARWISAGLRNARTLAGAWRVAGHVVAVATVLVIVRATGMSVWTYIIGVVWVGGALSLLRSFAEHRMTDTGPRSAIVRSGRLLSLLYLNNNLHHTHHVRPGVPWFQLPAVHDDLGTDELVATGAGVYTGYGEVARRYLLRPFDVPVRRAATMAVWTSSTTPAPTATA